MSVRAAARRRRDARNTTAGFMSLELAIIAPMLILLIFFAVQASLYYYARNVAQSASREGVSQLRVAPDQASYDAIRGRVITSTEQYAGQLGGQALRNPSADAAYDDAAGRVTVTVTGHVVSLVPLDITVTEQSSGSVERFRAP